MVCLNTDFGNMLVEVQFIVNCDSKMFNRFAAYDIIFTYFNDAAVVVNKLINGNCRQLLVVIRFHFIRFESCKQNLSVILQTFNQVLNIRFNSIWSIIICVICNCGVFYKNVRAG